MPARHPHAQLALPRLPRRHAARRAADTYGYLLVREPGFAANVELLLKLHNAGATIAEVPTVNDWTKRGGVSKMQLGPTVRAYGRLMAAHLVGRIQPPAISPLSDESPIEQALSGHVPDAPSVDGAAAAADASAKPQAA